MLTNEKSAHLVEYMFISRTRWAVSVVRISFSYVGLVTILLKSWNGLALRFIIANSLATHKAFNFFWKFRKLSNGQIVFCSRDRSMIAALHKRSNVDY